MPPLYAYRIVFIASNFHEDNAVTFQTGTPSRIPAKGHQLWFIVTAWMPTLFTPQLQFCARYM